jgi:hypothetical protein
MHRASTGLCSCGSALPCLQLERDAPWNIKNCLYPADAVGYQSTSQRSDCQRITTSLCSGDANDATGTFVESNLLRIAGEIAPEKLPQMHQLRRSSWTIRLIGSSYTALASSTRMSNNLPSRRRASIQVPVNRPEWNDNRDGKNDTAQEHFRQRHSSLLLPIRNS